jgi:phosphoribosyl 1,2-cyclic phosphate phosphodiesterase
MKRRKRILEANSRLVQRADVTIADAIVPNWFRIIKHMDADEAIEFAKQLEKETYVLSHLSHNYVL